MPESILVVGPAWVGDMVMAQSLFIRLRELVIDCTIDVVAPPWSLSLLRRMPQVREGIELKLEHGEFGLRERRQLGRLLRLRHYSRAIVLPNSWKSALVPFFAGIPRRTGYAGEFRFGLLNDVRRFDRTHLKTTVERFIALAEDCTMSRGVPHALLPRLDNDMQRAIELRSELGLPKGPVVALMPGAEYGASKRWPPKYFAELARNLGERGVRTWVFGSRREVDLGHLISSESGGMAFNLCGRTTLVDVVDLIALSNVAVSNDSGLMHVAAAAGVPIVAIYGSSTPSQTPPLTERKQVHYRALVCSPCFQRTCPLGHTNCLRDILPGEVLGSILKFIGI